MAVPGIHVKHSPDVLTNTAAGVCANLVSWRYLPDAASAHFVSFSFLMLKDALHPLTLTPSLHALAPALACPHPLTGAHPACLPLSCCRQVFAKFDTSEEKLEALSAELGVKALPVFKFYKVCSAFIHSNK
jgi:hypothetical protein